MTTDGHHLRRIWPPCSALLRSNNFWLMVAKFKAGECLTAELQCLAVPMFSCVSWARAPAAKFSPPSGQILKFIPHYEYTSVWYHVYINIVMSKVYSNVYKNQNQCCISQLFQLLQVTLIIRITVLFVMMSLRLQESSQPKNFGNIQKVGMFVLISLISLSRCVNFSHLDKLKSSY